MTINEPVVTLTDYGLALECALLAWLVLRVPGPDERLRIWFVSFFSTLGLSALAGGTVHGFIPDQDSLTRAVVWDLALVFIGLAGLSAWMIGALLIPSRAARAAVRGTSTIAFVAYCVVLLLVSNEFIVAIVHYLPATLFLLVVFLVRFGRGRETDYLFGTAGLTLTFVAAGIQQLRFGVHPVWFDHNALYHLIQAVAIGLIFVCARGVTRHGGNRR